MTPDQLRRLDWEAMVVEARVHVQDRIAGTLESLVGRWSLGGRIEAVNHDA